MHLTLPQFLMIKRERRLLWRYVLELKQNLRLRANNYFLWFSSTAGPCQLLLSGSSRGTSGLDCCHEHLWRSQVSNNSYYSNPHIQDVQVQKQEGYILWQFLVNSEMTSSFLPVYSGFFGDMNDKSQYFHLSPMTHLNPSVSTHRNLHPPSTHNNY